MIALKNILVPVDFSEPSRKAVTYGLTLAGQFNANLVLAHIVPESTALMYAFPTRLPDIENEQYARARREINNLAPAEHAAKLNLRTIVKIGNIEKDLLGIVSEEGIDLVVMGTHGRRYLGRWFIGSVTEHMLRNVPVPVLTVSHVKTGKHAIGLVSLQRILYATDLSESSNIGLKYVIELARGATARLTVVHVVDDDDRMLWWPALVAHLDRVKLLEEWRHKLDDFIRHKLDDFIKSESMPGIAIEGVLIEGKPFRKIVEFADAHSIDLIVLNLQSKSMVERALLGSTAERVVRLARTPVLSIPVAGRPIDQR
jgi:nucleotide-binding universal stress UspA family protein